MNILILIIVQIKTESVWRLSKEIVTTEGINALFVDSSDFSGILNIFGKYDSDMFEQGISWIIDTVRDAGIPIEMLTTVLDIIEGYDDAL